MTGSGRTIWISAGDVSGDRIGADLARALRRQCPDARLIGMGGVEMAKEGVDLRVDSAALAISGLLEILPSLARIVSTARLARRELAAADPDLVVLIDSGGFHLPLARFAHNKLRARVLYYVAPQIWVWRTGRIRKLAARTDRIAVILPFEPAFYAERGVAVDYVGHPLLDEPIALEPIVPADARVALDPSSASLPTRQSGELRLGLFPGSRRNELRYHLPVQLAVLRRLRETRPEIRGIVTLAPSLDRAAVQALIDDQAREDDPSIALVDSDPPLLDAIDVALTKPGTITLELMLRETPMVVIGIAQPLTAAFVRWVAKVAWVALPNLIAGRVIVPERIQDDAHVDRISADLAPLFPDGSVSGHGSAAAEEQREAFREARAELGQAGAAGRVAAIALEMIEEASVGTDRT